MNLRDAARGEDCQIRIPGVCNFDPATTVGCHVRVAGISGMGIKAPDLLMAWGCSACHDVVDGRRALPPGILLPQVEIWFYEGVMRTQAILIARGIVTW